MYKDKGDMPPLEAFPKSHRVTFKYYEGVLFFLEENYLEVSISDPHPDLADDSGREPSDGSVEFVLLWSKGQSGVGFPFGTAHSS